MCQCQWHSCVIGGRGARGEKGRLSGKEEEEEDWTNEDRIYTYCFHFIIVE